MTTALSMPADPVVKGATEIQSTNFAIVAADYTLVTYDVAQEFAARDGKGLESFPQPAKGEYVPRNWQWYLRNDMTGSSGLTRNLVGIKYSRRDMQIKVRNLTLSADGLAQVIRHRAQVHNWHPVVLTLTDGTVVTFWDLELAQANCYKDPEGNTLIAGDTTGNALYEAVGFMVTPVAAGKPTYQKLYNVASGVPALA